MPKIMLKKKKVDDVAPSIAMFPRFAGPEQGTAKHNLQGVDSILGLPSILHPANIRRHWHLSPNIPSCVKI